MRALVLLLGCLEAHPPDGYFVCAATEPRCPSGYHCASDNTCWVGEPPGLTLLAGGLGGPGTADGPGKGARFDGPSQIASDGAGHLYITDERSRTVRRFDAASGEVSTVAGNPDDMIGMMVEGDAKTARFVAPYGIAFANGGLYVTDGGRLRHITLSPGVQVATESVQVQSGRGLAWDGSALYISEAGRAVVSKWTPGELQVNVVAGTPMMPYPIGSFVMPTALALHQGVLYVTDQAMAVVLRVELQGALTGQVTVAAGTRMMPGYLDGAPGKLSFVNGIASDGNALFVADTGNQLLRRFVPGGPLSTAIGQVMSMGDADGPARPTARLNMPMGVGVVGGDVYVAEVGNHTLRKLDGGGMVTTPAGQAVHEGYGEESGGAARFRNPTSLATDGTYLYISDTGNSVVRRITADGKVSLLAGGVNMQGNADQTGADARFNQPGALACDGKILYVADAGNSLIRQIDLGTRKVSTLAGGGMGVSPDGMGTGARFAYPLGLALHGGNLFVADTSSNTIRQIRLSDAMVTTIAGGQMADWVDAVRTDARFNAPTGLAVDAHGDLYIGDAGNHLIRKMDLVSGMVIRYAGVPGTAGSADGPLLAATFDAPLNLLFDTDGALLVADYHGHTVRRLDKDGVTTPAGSAGQSGVELGPLPGRIHSPGGMALFAGGVALTVTAENAVLVMRR
jgi:NHL repeat